MYMSYSEIFQEQKKPLEYKIAKAVEAIGEAFRLSKHNQAIAFSGGKDSTVLWHIIRTAFPERKPYIIFGNTGVEFPESLHFARQIGKEWGGDYFVETELEKTKREGLKYQAQRETLAYLECTGQLSKVLQADGKLKTTETLERAATPEMWDDFRRRGLTWKAGHPKNYWWCIDQYGFPIMGKAASKLDARRINIDCFLTYSQSNSEKEELKEYYDTLRECKFSQHCCKILKKDPSERKQAELHVDVIFKGLMAAESRSRLMNFSLRGYIFGSSRKRLGNDPFYHVNPISIFTDDDIWEYIHRYNVPYAPLYDMEYTGKDGATKKIARNGCFGCATDILYKDNHLAVLHQTHPKMWDVLMKKGMADELQKLAKIKSNGNLSILSAFPNAEMAIERRPCAFDEIGEHVEAGIFGAEYDSEVIDE